MKYSVEEIKELMRAFRENGLQELRIAENGTELYLHAEAAVLPAAQPAAVFPAAPAGLPEAKPEGNLMRSPIVGTFYASPAPDAAPFVRVGDRVRKGDVLFIIESMKLMNEVTSEFDGTVAELLVQSGDPVEYGQAILRIE
ncbi:MAG: acetyl-CoA carboxylase biotin carboxyl carrier protein [Provencibacterium sp.]|jgi:acetyl-CoA carboxylase biotin carboxyl carrier protein|nr:acetyl-CoA carboxylase biotin carboxyl carrier protein [Provencibacterium sp.]